MADTLDNILERIIPILDAIRDADTSDDAALVTKIRLNILSLLEDVATYYAQHELTLWTKDNLATAISDVNWNINRGKPSTFMLTACLSSIEKATADKDEISPTYPHDKKRAEEIDKLVSRDFLDAINKLKPYASSYDQQH